MNEREFEEAYRDYGKRLFLVAYRTIGNADEAEDVLQEAFACAFTAWDSFRNESSRYTWLCKITLRRAYRHMKKTQGRLKRQALFERTGVSERGFLEGIQSGQDIENEAITEEVRELCLQAFLDCLPKKQRVVFTLRMILGLSVRETASVLEASEESVKITLHRAKRAIRETVEKRCDLFNPANPCSCWKWARHFTEGGTGMRPSPFAQERGNHARIREELGRESDYLRKLASLYSDPDGKRFDARLEASLRDLIESDRLRLLS